MHSATKKKTIWDACLAQRFSLLVIAARNCYRCYILNDEVDELSRNNNNNKIEYI